MKSLKYIFLSCALGIVSAYAQEGWRRAVSNYEDVFSRSPATATSGLASKSAQAKSFSLLSTTFIDAADEVTPYLQSLADGLGGDPVRIYEWVKNNIDFVPYNGLKRGAHLTAVERAGNAFDTSALLVALLKAGGHTDVTYQFGLVQIELERLDGKDAVHWVGVDKSQVAQLFFSAGCDYPGYYNVGGDSAYTFVQVPHVWVNLVISGTTYVLDPSFKQYRLNPPSNSIV